MKYVQLVRIILKIIEIVRNFWEKSNKFCEKIEMLTKFFESFKKFDILVQFENFYENIRKLLEIFRKSNKFFLILCLI